jgi:hypothetical protein
MSYLPEANLRCQKQDGHKILKAGLNSNGLLAFPQKNLVICSEASQERAMKFAVDSMLGKLARWLRILGYDVIYDPSLPIEQLVERANRDDRIVITRRKTFPDDVSPTTFFNVCSDTFPEQLRRLVTHLGLDTRTHLFTRCVDCNEPVRPIDKRSAAGRVPERTWRDLDQFFECPRCRCVYWDGSHRTNTLKKLQRILEPHPQ